MATSIFDDKAITPDESMTDAVLADTKALWDKIRSHAAERYPGLEQEWKFYSKKSGWSLVIRQKKRTLFYFIPCKGYFMITFVLGEKAERTAMGSSIPDHIKDVISAATSYAEGKSFFVDVRDEKDVEPVLTLFRIKNES